MCAAPGSPWSLAISDTRGFNEGAAQRKEPLPPSLGIHVSSGQENWK